MLDKIKQKWNERSNLFKLGVYVLIGIAIIATLAQFGVDAVNSIGYNY